MTSPLAAPDVFLLHSDEIRGLVDSAGLQLKTIELFTNPLTAGALRTRFLLRILPAPVISGIENITRSRHMARWRKIQMNMLVVCQKPGLAER